MAFLKSVSPILVTSIPSITMLPDGSTIRSKLVKTEDFPAPVRPTIPIWEKRGGGVVFHYNLFLDNLKENYSMTHYRYYYLFMRILTFT